MKERVYFTENQDGGFSSFLGWCISEVGTKDSATSHFWNAGLTIEYLDN